ncbi:MAG: hypothetical protein HY028_04650 [Gammaproteobacteria bacterium]|nr:hypothetical protein [Gammaproteobacteria bacterium]
MHLDIHQNAAQDLRDLRVVNPGAAAAVTVALEQIQVDPKAIDKLTTFGNNTVGAARLNIKRWESVRGQGNLWRFRVLDTPATVYRIVYGYHWQTRQICVLAVAHKEKFDYDDLNSDLARRILADWRTL